jgi:hypothetical protein
MQNAECRVGGVGFSVRGGSFFFAMRRPSVEETDALIAHVGERGVDGGFGICIGFFKGW